MAEEGFRNLGAFLQALRDRGDLAEIHAPVDPHLEVPEIHRRIIASGGPALLFHNPKNASFPLVTNLFGTTDRVDLAFGSRPEAIIARVASMPEKLMPPSLHALWQEKDLLWDLTKVGLARKRSQPVLDVRQWNPDLTKLPATTSWEEDGGPFFTLPLVYTQHPETGGSNLGIYRSQIFGPREAGLHWQIGKGGGFHYSVAERAEQPLPVNIFLGGPPALILSAIAPLPENVPEVLLASLVLGSKLPMAGNPAGPLPLAGEAEFALVGEVRPHERRPEGPFGDHYGYYSLTHDYPVFHCKAMFHREGAVLPATVVGKPRQEDFFIGDYLQELLSPVFPIVMPGVKDLWSYGETGYHSLASAVVKQRYKREAMVSALRILGEGQLSLTKFLLVTDTVLDLKDFKLVFEHVLARADFRTDLYVLSNVSMDTLDYTGPEVNMGSKGILLGVGDPIRDLPHEFSGDLPIGILEAQVFCKGCLVLSGPSYEEEPDLKDRLAQSTGLEEWPLVVLTDDAGLATQTVSRFLWTVFTRFEPAGDLAARKTEVLRHHVSYGGPLVLDARLHPNFPQELFCDPATAKTVTERWKEYFPHGMAMGDSDVAHLGAD